MISRFVGFAAAVSLLLAFRIGLFWARRSGRGLFLPAATDGDRWSLWELLLASFLTLFAELAFIRWIAVEVRVFAYFKNLALLLCFLGFGLGCALVRQRVRWSAALSAFLGLLLVVRVPWRGGRLLENLSQALGGAADVGIWATPSATKWTYFL